MATAEDGSEYPDAAQALELGWQKPVRDLGLREDQVSPCDIAFPSIVAVGHIPYRTDLPATGGWRAAFESGIPFGFRWMMRSARARFLGLLFESGNPPVSTPIAVDPRSFSMAYEPGGKDRNSLAWIRWTKEHRACLWITGLRLSVQDGEARIRGTCHWETGHTPKERLGLPLFAPPEQRSRDDFKRGQGYLLPIEPDWSISGESEKPARLWTKARVVAGLSVTGHFRISVLGARQLNQLVWQSGVPYMQLRLDLVLTTAPAFSCTFNGSHIPTQVLQVTSPGGSWQQIRRHDMEEISVEEIEKTVAAGEAMPAPLRQRARTVWQD